MKDTTVQPNGKVSLKNKLAFACGDVFGGGSFNIINFLFTPFLTLVVGIPMIYLTPILLLTKVWDGIVDPFIGMITDAKQPGKFGKRRIFMLCCAPLILVGLVLLFFPWNIVTTNTFVKCVFVVLTYMMYATAQSFVLIPYYSHASEMTDDFNERNNVNAVRLAFSIASGTICVAVPGMIASPEKASALLASGVPDNGVCYVVMAVIFGAIFAISVLVTALFSHEQIVTPSVKRKLNFGQFFRPLKVKTYRQYLGMQMCSSMAMAVMSSFFFTFCDFYLRRKTYFEVTTLGATGSRFPIATVAAAMMFVAQIVALPMYLKIIKAKSKRFAYVTGAFVWIGVVLLMLLLPAEQQALVGAANANGVSSVTTAIGTPNWAILAFGLALGLGIGGTSFVPHSAFGDVCDVGELYFGQRTEGAFSGLTNFLNTTAQAIGLAIPPLFIGLAGYCETQYVTLEQYQQFVATGNVVVNGNSFALSNFKQTVGEQVVQLMPMQQSESAQLAIRLCFILLPIAILAVGIAIASRYKLTKQLQTEIVEANACQDKDSERFAQLRNELLQKL